MLDVRNNNWRLLEVGLHISYHCNLVALARCPAGGFVKQPFPIFHIFYAYFSFFFFFRSLPSLGISWVMSKQNLNTVDGVLIICSFQVTLFEKFLPFLGGQLLILFHLILGQIYDACSIYWTITWKLCWNDSKIMLKLYEIKVQKKGSNLLI